MVWQIGSFEKAVFVETVSIEPDKDHCRPEPGQEHQETEMGRVGDYRRALGSRVGQNMAPGETGPASLREDAGIQYNF